MNEAIIKLTHDDLYYIDMEDYDIVYMGDRSNIDILLDAIIKLNKKINNAELSKIEIFKNYVNEHVEDVLYTLNKLFDNNYKFINDYIDNYDVLELLEYLINSNTDAEMLCNSNNCQFGTVGYSPWSYYVAWNDIDYSFIDDLYNGYNFYNIQLIKDDDVIDSISSCYIRDDKDLDDYIMDCFGLEDYYLVDNDESTYFNRPKVKEITHVSYTYEII